VSRAKELSCLPLLWSIGMACTVLRDSTVPQSLWRSRSRRSRDFCRRFWKPSWLGFVDSQFFLGAGGAAASTGGKPDRVSESVPPDDALQIARKGKRTGTATLEEMPEHAKTGCLTGGEEGVLAASLSNKGYDEARKNIEKLTRSFRNKECLRRITAPPRSRRRASQPGGGAAR